MTAVAYHHCGAWVYELRRPDRTRIVLDPEAVDGDAWMPAPDGQARAAGPRPAGGPRDGTAGPGAVGADTRRPRRRRARPPRRWRMSTADRKDPPMSATGTRWPIVYGRDDLTCPVPPARIARMVRHAKEQPWRGDTPVTDRRHILDTTAITELGRLTRCLFTLDYGYHASGWFANSEFDRCWHLSVSHPTNIPEVKRTPLQLGGGQHIGYRAEAPTDEEIAAWGRVFWKDQAPLALYEPPVGPLDLYRAPGVGHLRVWVDQQGRAFKPTGEVHHLRPFPDGSSPAKVTEGRLGGDVR